MEPVRNIVGRALPLARADVDTDQIIPSHWLKRLERTGYGPGLFEAWRKDPAFVLNDPRYRGATVLLAGANFGGGSSREHAVWALLDAGFRAVIAPRVADIFRNNALRNGFVPVEVDADTVASLVAAVRLDPATTITIDVEHATVQAPWPSGDIRPRRVLAHAAPRRSRRHRGHAAPRARYRRVRGEATGVAAARPIAVLR